MGEASVDGSKDVDFLRCDMNTDIWKGPNALCGFNGSECTGNLPIGTEIRFRCPANCWRESWAYREMPAGTQVSYHDSFVVGSETFRGDSFVCAAALHRGVISNRYGGCGVLKITGPQPSFRGSRGNNSITSLDFDTEFVQSYSFLDPNNLELRGCTDTRFSILVVSLIAILIYAYMGTNPKATLYAMVIIGFWTVILAANPPLNGGNDEENAEIISLAFRRLLPCLLATYAIYQLVYKHLFVGMKAHLSKAIFWALPFYCGIWENYVFGLIPIDRLTFDDLNSQAGAWFSLLLIIIIVLLIACGQAYVIWRAGKFWKYLSSYIFAFFCLFLLALLPEETLRIHHYILALIFLPGTAFQTTPSLFYNGLLSGLFVAGVARWDFDSIVQTYDQLRRGGVERYSGEPYFLEPLVRQTSSALVDLTVKWSSLNESNTYGKRYWNGFSLIINDVERYRGTETSFNLTKWALESFDIAPTVAYVRIAVADMFSRKTGGFTLAAIANLTSGEWTPPLDGRI